MIAYKIRSYFYGLPWSKHIVIYDTLIEQSTPAEVEAVLGHELGHWYYCTSTSLMTSMAALLDLKTDPGSPPH